MQDVFGPGGLLERCMIGGYEHRPAQLQMAETVNDAFAQHHHAVVEAGTGTGKTLACLLPANLQRAARRNFHRNKIAARAALSKGHSVSTKSTSPRT